MLVSILSAVSGSLLGSGPFCDWQSEYNGTSSNTIALYKFSPDDLYTNGADICTAVLPRQEDGTWDAYYPAATATCSFSADGKFGGGLVCPGGTQSVARCMTQDGTDVFPSGADPSLTVECWVRFNDASGIQYLVSKGNGWSSVGGYDLWFLNGTLNFAISDGSGPEVTSATWEPSCGVWHHVAATWDAATDAAGIFVDGLQLTAKRFSGLVIVDHPVRSLTLGNRAVNLYYGLNGVIDEVRISNVAYRFAAASPSFAPGHPRLFFSADDYYSLESRRWSTHNDAWNSVIDKCEALKGTSPTTTPRTATGLLVYEEDMASMAVAQMIDPNLPYYSTSTNWFWTVLNWKEWGEGYWYWPDYGPRGNLETAEVLKGLAIWYDLMYHTLTPAQRADIEQKLSDYADRFRKSYSVIEADSGGVLGNHCWNALVAVAAVKYAVDNISPSRMSDWTDLLDRQYALIRYRMCNEMHSGATGEGLTYWTYGMEKLTHWFEMRRRAGEPAFEGVDWLQNTGLYGIYSILPGGTDNFGGVNKFSDSAGTFWGNPFNDLALLAKNTRDGATQWLCTQLDGFDSSENVFRYLFYDPSVQPIDPARDLNNWHFFDDYGIFLWRTDWNNDATYFALRSGQHSHGHDKCDDGQFMIHRAGIPYITNLGYAVPRYTQDSNVLLVDGVGQVSDGDDWGIVFEHSWPDNSNTWGRTLHLLATERTARPGGFFDVLTDPSAMYTNAPFTADWHREAVGLGDDLFLVRDTLAAGSSHTFSLLLHSYVTAKGTGTTYDQDTYKNSDPWTVLDTGRWELDVRNETPEPPNMLVQDLSRVPWSSAVEPTYYHDKYSGYTRRGSKLVRSVSAASASSLVSFGFDDRLAGWTQTAWTHAAAEGVHVTSGAGKVIDVLWPADGVSCTNSDGWTVAGKMAGRRYAQTANDPDACYFGREVSSITDSGLSLVASSAPVSLYANIEQAIGGSVPDLITISSDAGSTVTLYAPHAPQEVRLDGESVPFSWLNNQLTITIPACDCSRIELL